MKVRRRRKAMRGGWIVVDRDSSAPLVLDAEGDAVEHDSPEQAMVAGNSLGTTHWRVERQ